MSPTSLRHTGTYAALGGTTVGRCWALVMLRFSRGGCHAGAGELEGVALLRSGVMGEGNDEAAQGRCREYRVVACEKAHNVGFGKAEVQLIKRGQSHANTEGALKIRECTVESLRSLQVENPVLSQLFDILFWYLQFKCRSSSIWQPR